MTTPSGVTLVVIIIVNVIACHRRHRRHGCRCCHLFCCHGCCCNRCGFGGCSCLSLFIIPENFGRNRCFFKSCPSFACLWFQVGWSSLETGCLGVWKDVIFHGFSYLLDAAFTSTSLLSEFYGTSPILGHQAENRSLNIYEDLWAFLTLDEHVRDFHERERKSKCFQRAPARSAGQPTSKGFFSNFGASLRVEDSREKATKYWKGSGGPSCLTENQFFFLAGPAWEKTRAAAVRGGRFRPAPPGHIFRHFLLAYNSNQAVCCVCGHWCGCQIERVFMYWG